MLTWACAELITVAFALSGTVEQVRDKETKDVSHPKGQYVVGRVIVRVGQAQQGGHGLAAGCGAQDCHGVAEPRAVGGDERGTKGAIGKRSCAGAIHSP